ncbi:MAG: ABC transporter ATP-binding protein [Lachnospiraceae bacterium]|jgi:ABC-type nitrate/sulfonate/bicarbonate transport system, ATPase component|nr:ABC transporter ATP-binding protein [Lachnospiraceae bacterium]
MSLILQGLCKRFDNSEKDTLHEIDLEVKSGEFVCIVGASGCGKSTLLNLVAGLEQPTSGKVLLDDKEVKGPGSDRTVMFQEHGLFPWLSVAENVKFGMKLAGVSKEQQEQKAKYYLEMVNLWDYRDYPIHQVSGGMRQRTALARSLTMESKVLLMDEPFSALDKQTSNRLREELQRIWMETKQTILFITHSVEEAVYLADRVVVLSPNTGKVAEVVTVELKRPRHVYAPEFVELRHKILEEVRGEAV